MLYYDCTNFFFEVEQEDNLRKYGKSKENRPTPIVQMGLFMDADGIPLSYNSKVLSLLEGYIILAYIRLDKIELRSYLN